MYRACGGLIRSFALISIYAFEACLAYSQQFDPPEIAYEARTVLIGAEGSVSGAQLIDMGPGKMGWVQSWKGKTSSVSWQTRVQRSGEYELSVIVESSVESCTVDVGVDGKTLHGDCGGEGWKRITLGTERLTAGKHSFQVTSSDSARVEKFFSLELIRPEVKKRLEETGLKQRADTQWMVVAKYGLMFHWTSQSMPPRGQPFSYCDAVRNFDVDRFAEMVQQTGAGFVVFTTSHAGFYFPGPNAEIDKVLPGRTCPRDLVGDLADGLGRRKIRLELYFHPGHDDREWWQRTHFDSDKNAYFLQWRSIISSIGNQYGSRLAGWWFDDAAFTYYPFNPDWEKMTGAARSGNPGRLITYNSWILPKLNDFYDVFAGENSDWDSRYSDLKFLPVGGSGRYVGGPQSGLQAEISTIINGDWGHFKRDEPISSPRFSVDQIAQKVEDALSRRQVPLLDVEIYQDGTISPETLRELQGVRMRIDDH